MNAISAQNLFSNIEFHSPCDLNNDMIGKIFRTKALLETLLKSENAAACELEADEKSDFVSLYKEIATGLKAINLLGDGNAFYHAMMATWKAMSDLIDEYFDAYGELKTAYDALLNAERRHMADVF